MLIMLFDMAVGPPIPYMHDTDDTTTTSFLPESKALTADRRSLSMSSFMARSFSIYVSDDGI